MVVHTCNPSTKETEAKVSKSQEMEGEGGAEAKEGMKRWRKEREKEGKKRTFKHKNSEGTTVKNMTDIFL